MTGVRFRSDVGFEGQCSRCLEWWPLDNEYWKPRQGLGRCLACIREIARLSNAARRQNPETRAYDREALALKRVATRGEYLAARRDYYRKNRDHILALRRAAYLAAAKAASDAAFKDGRVARQLAYKREWMRRHRAKIETYYRVEAA